MDLVANGMFPSIPLEGLGLAGTSSLIVLFPLLPVVLFHLEPETHYHGSSCAFYDVYWYLLPLRGFPGGSTDKIPPANAQGHKRHGFNL